jgi:hypothetical protein
MMAAPTPYYEDPAGIAIYHGRVEEVLPRLGLGEVDLLVADPPYGIAVEGQDRGRPTIGGGARGIPPTEFPSFIDGDRDGPYWPPRALLGLLPGPAVWWGANHYSHALPAAPGWLVWDKRHKGGSCDFADAELAWSNLGGVVRVFRHYWNGMIRDSERGPRLHPMQKPVALMKWILNMADLPPGSLVLEPYCGSAPVARACKDLGLRCVSIDSLEWCCERAAERLRQEVLAFEEPELEEPEAEVALAS